MNAQRKILTGCILIGLILSVCFLVVPKLRFSAARKKYPIGMSLEKASGIAKAPFETAYPAYPISPSGKMAEAEKQSTVVVGLRCPTECVLLGFNSYSNLVDLQPLNDPIDTFLWMRSRK